MVNRPLVQEATLFFLDLARLLSEGERETAVGCETIGSVVVDLVSLTDGSSVRYLRSSQNIVPKDDS